MLIQCKECGNNISDKAEQCPNCAYPIKNKLSSNGIILIVILIFLSTAYMWRYDLTAVSDNMIAYRLDRWTGNIDILSGNRVVPMEENQSAQ